MNNLDDYAVDLYENYEAGVRKLAELVANKKVVGVGESTHGTHEFFQLKADLFVELHQKQTWLANNIYGRIASWVTMLAKWIQIGENRQLLRASSQRYRKKSGSWRSAFLGGLIAWRIWTQSMQSTVSELPLPSMRLYRKG
ncbi:MAG: hypothetical protein WD467_02755 [Candidatus Saccharimonadales bacterium]